MENKKAKVINIKVLSLLIIIFSIIIIVTMVLSTRKKVIATSSELADGSNVNSNLVENENITNTENNIEEENQVIGSNIEGENQTIGNKQEEQETEEDTKGVIYLTFDDGPSSSTTPKILDILKQEDVKATFFIINYDDKKADLVRREVEEGHSVGIHGYSHNYKEIYKSEESYMENLNKLQAKIEETTGTKTTITRFPGGSSNTISKFNKKIMTKLTKRVEKEGYKYYDWNVDSDDAGSAKNKKDVYKNVTSNLSLKRANVVLMHDFANNNKTIDALKKIIKYGKENGYKFRAITANSAMQMHHNVLN